MSGRVGTNMGGWRRVNWMGYNLKFNKATKIISNSIKKILKIYCTSFHAPSPVSIHALKPWLIMYSFFN